MTDPIRGKLIANAPIAKLNTWRVGGCAKQLFKPVDMDDLVLFMQQLEPTDLPVWLGLGSNVLIADAGISHTVIAPQSGLKTLSLEDETIIRAEAGVTCAKAAKFCVKHDLLEGEFFAGIPGTIGGALRMNAGAFGGETWDFVIAVETIDRQGKIRKRSADEYQTSYRTVKGPGITEGESEWFVTGYFKLPSGDGQITADNIKALLKKRGETQPIGLPSCGSVFINPEGYYSARLIEDCGLKGFSMGGAQVSEKHANFIINTGTATAADIMRLIKHVQTTVQKKHNILLRTEVRMLGEFSE